MRHPILLLAGVLFVLCPSDALARQPRATIDVAVRAFGKPVPDAEVTVGGATWRTDESGRTVITVPPGRVELTVTREGFAPASVAVEAGPGQREELHVALEPEPTHEEHVTVVATTRTGRRLEDQPTRVEVLAREEIEEKMLMTPGDIVMMLNEMGGMRVQATSPSLGAASVRIQGMRGRYTRVLSDGLPLHGEVGGLGLLQIPPMDLGQVEVIKGVASAMYGAGAMGGVVNLLSRRPGPRAEREFLINQSTRGATDAVAYLSGPLARGWSASLLGGGHWHRRADVDADGWADLPRYGRGVARPRVFWDGGDGRSFFATGGVTYEDREGGGVVPGTSHVEALGTRRYDAGATGQFLAGRSVVTARAAVTRQEHDHRFGAILERDRHTTAFAEIAVRGAAPRQTWVAGLAIERDAYDPRDVPRFAYAFVTPGAFVQYDADLTRLLSFSASGRLDVHSRYGTFFSPKLSALVRTGGWSGRLSVGSGFFASTPVTEETEAAGLTHLVLQGPLEAERGVSASLDLSRTDGPLSSTVTFFASRVSDPLYVERETSYSLGNLGRPTTTTGIELLATVRREPWAATATYTYLRAREGAAGLRQDVALTPRHSAGVVAMWEDEETGRVGVEWYYTGRQRLEANPFRSRSEPYALLGVLAERRLGRLRLFINGENLTGVRQTRWGPLIRPSSGADGRWTVDGWSPLDGRTINGGLRLVL